VALLNAAHVPVGSAQAFTRTFHVNGAPLIEVPTISVGADWVHGRTRTCTGTKPQRKPQRAT